MKHGGGKVKAYVPIQAIFWGNEWNDSNYAGDKIAGIDTFYDGYGNSSYSRVLNEYLLDAGYPSFAVIDYQGHVIDDRSELHTDSYQTDNALVRTEICSLITQRRVSFSSENSYFAVYSAKKPPSSGQCAIEGTAWCYNNAANVFSYALFYNLDENEQCDPNDHLTGHSQGLSSIANISARALSDLISDQDFRGFYDPYGNEIDDKCAWTFNVPFVTFTNGSIWKLQGLWSNAAYEAGTGYPNANGERGCIDGR